MQKNTMILKSLPVLLLFATVSVVQAQGIREEGEHAIRLNQIGFYPQAPKTAVMEGDFSGAFHVTSADGQDTLYSGTIEKARSKGYGSRHISRADFSSLTEPGIYRLRVPGLGRSHPFEISNGVHKAVAKAALKGFYFQRASTGLPKQYAGKWHRRGGHPDDRVLVHPSAASPGRPAGTVIEASRGWYDAGDYNKYIVNSGITMGTLLSFFEDYPEFAAGIRLNVPESSNELPDLLDEILWNLRWMITMQDPGDGGVYHKMTSAGFSAMVMPEEDTATRYVVQKSTAASLNFAAVMAQSARIFTAYSKQLPGLADTCLSAAEKAWEWAQVYPEMIYDQNELNRQFDPDITTGAYGGRTLSDEYIWAAAELYVSTGNEQYLQVINGNIPDDEPLSVPSWSHVKALGYYTLLRFGDVMADGEIREQQAIRHSVLALADTLVERASQNPFKTVMGYDPGHFVWGSNSVAANQGMLLLQAYRQKPKQEYIDYALANLDYLLGRNGTGYSFVTGYGSRTPMFPHHRPSVADGVDEPVPGLLAGGPNPGQQDECEYPSDLPDQSYTDAVCSYASNEIAINWNAPLVYLSGALEALQYEAGYSGQ